MALQNEIFSVSISNFTFPEADPPATPIRKGFGGVFFINSLLTGTNPDTDAMFKTRDDKGAAPGEGGIGEAWNN